MLSKKKKKKLAHIWIALITQQYVQKVMGAWLIFEWLLAVPLGSTHMTDVCAPFAHTDLSLSLCKHLQLLCSQAVNQEPALHDAQATTESIFLRAWKTCCPAASTVWTCVVSLHDNTLKFNIIIIITQLCLTRTTNGCPVLSLGTL